MVMGVCCCLLCIRHFLWSSVGSLPCDLLTPYSSWLPHTLRAPPLRDSGGPSRTVAAAAVTPRPIGRIEKHSEHPSPYPFYLFHRSLYLSIKLLKEHPPELSSFPTYPVCLHLSLHNGENRCSPPSVSFSLSFSL